MQKDLIKQAQQAYDEGHPIMSDEAFDNLTNDESQFKLTEDTYTIKHQHLMGTLPKSHSAEEVNNFLRENTYYVQPKFDGISCEIILDNGKVKSISTRGKGDYGKDLQNLAQAGFLQNTNFNPALLSVYGELTRYYGNPSQKDRNYVAGVCNSSKPTSEDVKHLRFNVFKAYTNEVAPLMPYELEQIYICDNPIVRHSKCFEITTPITEETSKEIFSRFDEMYKSTKRDGIVFRDINGTDLLALKPEPKSAVTKIEDVSWTKGKEKFAATAIISPVEISGTTISKVTLPEKYIHEMDLHINDYIEIIRAGDVIPKIVRKVKDGENQKEITPNTKCEYCGNNLQKVGKSLVCETPNCESFEINYLQALVDLLSKHVKRLPKSKFNKLIKSKVITLSNLFDLEKYSSSLTENDLIKVKECYNLLKRNHTKINLLAFNVSGLSKKYVDNIFNHGHIELEDLLESEDPIWVSVKYILENSKEIKSYLNKCKSFSEVTNTKEKRITEM